MKNHFRTEGDVTYITLNRRKSPSVETVIDTADLPRVDAFERTWSAQWNESTASFYVIGSVPIDPSKLYSKHRRIYLHRLILGDVPNGWEVDHINHDTVDNRRANLRAATHKDNMENRRKSRAELGIERSLKGKGYYFCCLSGMWLVILKRDKKVVVRERYETEEEAKAAVTRLRADETYFPKAA
jgi:hypothetical protein